MAVAWGWPVRVAATDVAMKFASVVCVAARLGVGSVAVGTGVLVGRTTTVGMGCAVRVAATTVSTAYACAVCVAI